MKCEMNMDSLFTHIMYSKYSLFYKFPKNLGYFVHVSTKPLFGGRAGDEAKQHTDSPNNKVMGATMLPKL